MGGRLVFVKLPDPPLSGDDRILSVQYKVIWETVRKRNGLSRVVIYSLMYREGEKKNENKGQILLGPSERMKY